MTMDQKRWKWSRLAAVGMAALAVGVGGWAASRSPEPVPPVAAWLLIEAPRSDFGREGMCDQPIPLASWRQTQAVLNTSPNVLHAAAFKLESQSPTLVADKADPVEWLSAGLKVSFLSDSIIAVSMPGEARQDQAKIVNGVVDEYLALAGSWESGRQQRIAEVDAAALKNYRSRLSASRKALREVPSPDSEVAAALRDEIAVLEEVAQRVGVAVELHRHEVRQQPTVRLLSEARR